MSTLSTVVVICDMLLLLVSLTGLSFCQNEPTAADPPHNCPNFALCSPFVNWNQTTLDCPTGKCVCQPGTTGPDCEIVDQCVKKPCGSGNFNCTSDINSYTCSCSPGYTGAKCNIPLNSPCATGPCQNGCTCTTSQDGKSYVCSCPNGYLSPNCQYQDPCKAGPCKNGTCSALYNGASYYCTCNFDYIGRNCDSRKTTWAKNSGQIVACYDYNKLLEDSSKFKKFTDSSMTASMCASFLESYTGDGVIYTMFVVMEKSCYLTTTNYFGNATNYLNDRIVNSDCKKLCPDWTSGQNCGTNNKKVLVGVDNATAISPDTCGSLPTSTCSNSTGNGICISLPVSKSSDPGYTCVCKPPYTANSSATGCDAPSDPCTPSPCQNNGTCTASSDLSTFSCTCEGNWLGDTCQYQNPCNPSPCQYGGTCQDNGDETYKCNCLGYFHGQNCTEIDACEYANPCVNGDCKNLGTGIQVRPQCKCKSGYTGQTCNNEINYCTVYTPCQYNGTCTPQFMGYSCSCIPGITGKNCSQIIDNCVQYKDASGKSYDNRCKTKDDKAICVNAINSFSCNCSTDWTGQFCEMNVIIEEVMITLFGSVNYALLPLLNNLLMTPAAIATMVPFILGTLNETTRESLSWSYDDMFYWATFEEKELEEQRDFFKWNDVVLGNCFTFNHLQSNQSYAFRSSKTEGGFKARMKINQAEYQPWTDTAAIMVFIHNQRDYIFSESIRYNAEPNSEVKMYTYGEQYTRLGGAYGRCVREPSEVKSYYYPGSYTADGCYRSCYQDLILKSCGCIDPRYPGPPTELSCKVTNMSCIDDAVDEYGDPSTWPSCDCPVPCENQNFMVSWSKMSYRQQIPNCIDPMTYSADPKCQANTADSVLINVAVPTLTYSLFAETPQMDLNKFIGSLGALLGVLMGIGAISFIEVGVVVFRLLATGCCFNKESARKKWEEKKRAEENYRGRLRDHENDV